MASSSSRARSRRSDSSEGGEENDLETCFNTFAKRGKLETLEEVGTCIRALGKNPTEEELAKLVEDAGGLGRGIELEKFRTIFNQKMPKPEDQRDACENAFQALDRDGSGTIREAKLRQVLCSVGEPIPAAQVDMLVRRLAPGPSGEIPYHKLLDLLCSNN